MTQTSSKSNVPDPTTEALFDESEAFFETLEPTTPLESLELPTFSLEPSSAIPFSSAPASEDAPVSPAIEPEAVQPEPVVAATPKPEGGMNPLPGVETAPPMPEKEVTVAPPAGLQLPTPPTFSPPSFTAPSTTPPLKASVTDHPAIASPATAPASPSAPGLRNRLVLVALVLSVIPVGILGGINVWQVNQSLSSLSETSSATQTVKVKQKLSDQLSATLWFGLLLTAGIVGAIAYVLAERSGQGDFPGAEGREAGNLPAGLASLGETEQSDHLKAITLKIAAAVDSESVLEDAVQEARQFLGADRVIVYEFDEDWAGTIITESVGEGFPKALGAQIADPCFAQRYVDKYLKGRVQATANILEAGLTPCHLNQLLPFQVKANLVAPIVRKGKLLGLFIAHQCSAPRHWKTGEISFFGQLATQVGLALERTDLVQQLRSTAKQAQLLKAITLKMSAALDSDTVFDTAVGEIRRALSSDRVIIYRFDENWAGTIIAESVGEGFPKALGAQINDPCFADKYVEKYREGRVQATPNIYEAGLTPCHLGQLAPFDVKANLVAPVVRKGELLALLIAHQCSAPREWEQNEIDFFGQLATEVGLALERTDLVQQLRFAESEQRAVREKLQKRAMELLMEVDPVSRGDLTIRAHVTEDEIGTIADSYNATIENLRRIVTQVQEAATQFASTTDVNARSVSDLSQEAMKQAEDIAQALERLQAMTQSIQAVAANAEMAESAVQQATQTVDAGEDAMNRTVDGILAIRETVAATAKKVKRLGESSQKISKVVNLISSFADQTNLLALNAAIEAAHAGEEGRGFAVVADEVRSLARQSAEATAEIADLVASIQSETNEVVIAMETGTEQVVMGTRLVDETRKSLNLITAASAQISELVEAIAQAAVEQSQTSQTVTQTMAQVAAISDKTSLEAAQVSNAFKELLAVAQSLQDSVRQFKVS
jgi:methyl-accepting chemotaxis protein PixJ